MKRAPLGLLALLSLAPGLVFLAACNGGDDTGGELAVAGPELEHTQPEGLLVEGDSIELVVSATDPQGVLLVRVYFRTQGTDYWDVEDMVQDGDTWSWTQERLVAPGLEYYFRAKDGSASGAESGLPEAGATDPFLLAVREQAWPLPFQEDFESESSTATLFELDWWTPSDGYDAYAWKASTGVATSGTRSALHSRGNDGVSELADWLISPAIDLSTVDGAMVTWQELGRTTDELEEHGLYISTGSRLPEDGDFVAVEAVLDPPTEDDWGRSAAIDLSAWAGEPVVYLGWFYRGSYADDWFIDDVLVEELAADLNVDLSWSPDPVYAGDTATITLNIDNLTNAASGEVTATMSLPDGGGSFTSDSLSVGTISALGTASVDFELDIDSSTPDHSYLSFGIELSDGASAWSFERDMVVGLPSSGELDLTLTEATLVRVEFGTGKVDDPDLKVSGIAKTLEAGSHTVTVDLTAYHELLPPAAGLDRWWAKVSTTGNGSVDDFVISYGGETWLATSVPLSMSDVDTEDAYVVYLPEPPDPVLTSVSPTKAKPGETGIAPTFTLTNEGDATVGAVTATLSTSDPDLTILSGADFTVTTAPWELGERVSASGPLLEVSAAHVDSTPVEMEILLDDGVESWVLDASIAVPWPVFRAYRVSIDDSGNDGVLDSGETATVEIELANSGQLASFGPVYGTATVANTSTATATVSGASEYFGSISVGATRDGEFELTGVSGAPGDTIDLELALTDGTNSYTSTTTIVLGEKPWAMLSASDDTTADNLDGYGFDFLNGSSRILEDGRAELWLVSDEPFDKDTLFIEIWGRSSGTSYAYYRWVLQSGVVTLQGYSGGFSTIGSADVTFLSDTELILDWDTADMELVVDSFTIGLAAGWCGPPDYFCDHFPNGWGYPYDSFSTGSWFEVAQ